MEEVKKNVSFNEESSLEEVKKEVKKKIIKKTNEVSK
jgi:hypothetical protein